MKKIERLLEDPTVDAFSRELLSSFSADKPSRAAKIRVLVALDIFTERASEMTTRKHS